jgi:hypothetical protein
MTTVKDVLIYEALERNKIYKENKKKELSDSKRKLKPQKASEKAIATVSKSKKNKVTGAKVTKMHKAIKKTKTDTNYKQDFLISR